ncbi:MAG: peptidylprolyl isomerase [Gemmataceae bacterium]|nr:peptidylprolyl isomerase [Gemmataceae bacterium]
MTVQKGVLGGLAGVAALAVLVSRLWAQAPAQPPQTPAAAPAAPQAPAQAPAAPQVPAKAPAQPIHAPTPAADKPAAVVNGESIPMAEVLAVLNQQPPPSQPLNEAQKREVATSAVQMLIEDLLMRQFLRKNAQPAPPAEVGKELAELQEDLKKSKLSMQDFLKESGQTLEQLRADIAARVQWKGYISPRTTDQVAKTYYDQNKLFFDKVLVRASHILIRVAANATPADRQAAQQKLQALRQEIVANKIDFAEAAKKYSDCPSKQNGGDIGPFPYKFAVAEPFARAAFAMKVGDVSDIVATEFGLHLIKVTNRENGQPSEFEKVKEQVKTIHAQEVYQAIILEQRRTAQVQIYYPAQQ